MSKLRSVLRPLAAAACLSFLAAQAQAATVVASTTVDLLDGAVIQLSPQGVDVADYNPGFPLGGTFAVAAGDHLTFTITFANHEQLTVQNPSYIFAWIGAVNWPGDPSQSVDITSSGTLSFLDSHGATVFQTAVVDQTAGAVHAGEYYFGGDLAPSLTFSGVRYDGDVISYGDGRPSRSYDTTHLEIAADSVTVGIVAVPEPASWAMMLFGFGAIGATMRLARRRAAAAAAVV